MKDSLHYILSSAAEEWAGERCEFYREATQKIRESKASFYNSFEIAYFGRPCVELLLILWNKGLDYFADEESDVVCTTKELANTILSEEWFEKKNFHYDKHLYRFWVGELELRAYKPSSAYGESCCIRVHGDRFNNEIRPYRKGVSAAQYAELLRSLAEFYPEAMAAQRAVDDARNEIIIAERQMTKVAEIEMVTLENIEGGTDTPRYKELKKLKRDLCLCNRFHHYRYI